MKIKELEFEKKDECVQFAIGIKRAYIVYKSLAKDSWFTVNNFNVFKTFEEVLSYCNNDNLIDYQDFLKNAEELKAEWEIK